MARLTAFAELSELSDEQKAACKRSLARMRKGYSLGKQMPKREVLHLSEDFQHDRIADGVQFCNPFKLQNPIDYIFK